MGDFFQILWASHNILTSPARPCPARSCAARPHPVSPRPSGPAHPGDAQLGRARPREAQKISKNISVTKTFINRNAPRLKIHYRTWIFTDTVFHVIFWFSIAKTLLLWKLVKYFLDFCSVQLLHLDWNLSLDQAHSLSLQNVELIQNIRTL